MPDATFLRAAFIDRDGVINAERGYVYRIEDFELLPGAASGLRRLQQAGYAIVVVTNQAGIARGLYTVLQYETLTSHMVDLLAADGIAIAGVYFCPHHPTEGVGEFRATCNCRKPAPGMLLRAQRELGLDLSRSVIIGDKQSDIAAGRTAGVARCVLVRSGHAVTASDAAQADATVDGLDKAAEWIVHQDAC